MSLSKAVINEARQPYIVQIPVDTGGLAPEISRRILGFHKSRRITPRHGRSITKGHQIYCRWCFSDLATARAFVGQFGGTFYKTTATWNWVQIAHARRGADIAKAAGAFEKALN
jgi:hypothetical protein